ncbi:RNA-directed DNA polymerase, eukaryota, reverse transcriptase zinc-binding domain protein [Tanacetum coccineum]|uniref:RNA-directed DNA polymerase, eukaryota, reverse transcriptase zinc-binding domain protein n=1 Tax=Tanacetum coccineum TaxID=301880 RepID=A0ABQ5FHH2_9ASTR
MSISHLMYADDIIFFGDWSWVNAHNLISMLRCFFLISGLKINIHKSHVLGVGVTDDEVSHMANIIGCGAANLPLKYLGVPAQLLSVGGRLSLIKSVLGNLPTYYMSIYLRSVSIRKKLESMHNNFFIGGDPNEKKMTWIGNGADSSFWKDTWYGGQPLKAMFPRIFLFDNEKNCSIANRVRLQDWSLVLRRQPRGGWASNSAGFSVASVRSLVDTYLLDTANEATRWNRNIPIKVNVFLWRLKLNKLPSRVNLDRRGIVVDSILCPICHGDFETVNHCFFNCVFAKDVWSLLAKWWELYIPVCDNIVEWFAWLDSLRVPSKVRLEELITLAKFYPNEFSINELSRLSDQLDNYIHDMRKDERFIGLKDVGELSKKLVELKKHTTFDLVYLLIKLVLILPVATASVERTFSAMTFVKNKLRNSIGDQFLNDCLVTYVEKDIFSEVSDDAIMNRFQRLHSRRGYF